MRWALGKRLAEWELLQNVNKAVNKRLIQRSGVTGRKLDAIVLPRMASLRRLLSHEYRWLGLTISKQAMQVTRSVVANMAKAPGRVLDLNSTIHLEAKK